MNVPNKPNPWGLQPREVQVMCAIIDTGGHKAAARVLGMSHKTVELHVQRVKRCMESSDKLTHYLLFDRWRREQPAQEPQ